MVWILTGTLQSSKDDEANEVPAETSHYLRPDRLYRAGRLGVQANSNDFRIKTNTIPKAGLWDISTGAWNEEMVNDDPDNPGNEKSYPIVLTSKAKLGSLILTRDGVNTPIAPATPLDLVSGDKLAFSSDRYSFKFDWEPIIFCVDKFPKNSKPKYIKNAISAGVKISSGRPFAPYHTHLIKKSPFEPDLETYHAAMYARPITSLAWVDLFFESTHVPERPAELPSPSPELSGQAKIDATESDLLKLNPDIGSDFNRYWGHSALEMDYRSLPSSAGLLKLAPKFTAVYSAAGWCTPNEKRCDLFNDVLFISLRGDPNRYDSDDKLIIQAGSGAFLALSPLDAKNQPADPAQLTLAVQQFNAALVADKNRSATNYRLCIIRPALLTESRVEDTSEELSQDSSDEAKLAWVLGRLAKEFGLTKYIERADIIDAIYTVDKSSLLPPLAASASQAPSSSSASCLVRDTPSAYNGTQRSTMGAPAPSGELPGGTHPEESFVAPGRPGGLRSNAATTAAAPPVASPAAPAADAEVMGPPKTLKKLTRRVNVKPPPSSYDEDPYSMDLATESPQVLAPDSSAAASRANTGPASSYYDNDMDTSQVSAPPGRMKLKRRVGTAAEVDSRFEPLESPERPQKKTRFSKESFEEEEEEEEEANSTALTSQAVSQQTAPTTAQKRSRYNSESEADQSESEAASPKKKSRVVPTPVAKKVEKVPVKPGAKGKAAPIDPKYMQVKTARRGGAAAAEADAALDADFNALKLIKPTYAPVVKEEGKRINWDEDDAEDVQRKMMEEDQDQVMQWGNEATQKGKFVIKYFEIKPRENNGPRTDLAVEEKWANRPNYKKFKPKAGTRLAGVAPKIVPKKVELVLAKGPDFGLGAQYRDEPDQRVNKKKGKKANAISFDDDDGPSTQTQSKLNFTAARGKPTNAKASTSKGKARVIIQDSDEEDELATPSATYDQNKDRMDLDSDEEDQLASQKSSSVAKKAPAKSTTARKSAASTSAKAKAPVVKAKAPAKAKAVVTKKRAAQVSEDDSDDGFEGLKYTSGTAKRRK